MLLEHESSTWVVAGGGFKSDFCPASGAFLTLPRLDSERSSPASDDVYLYIRTTTYQIGNQRIIPSSFIRQTGLVDDVTYSTRFINSAVALECIGSRPIRQLGLLVPSRITPCSVSLLRVTTASPSEYGLVLGIAFGCCCSLHHVASSPWTVHDAVCAFPRTTPHKPNWSPSSVSPVNHRRDRFFGESRRVCPDRMDCDFCPRGQANKLIHVAYCTSIKVIC